MKLKYLSYPVFIYSFYTACKGIYELSMSGTVDIGWVYAAIGIQHIGYAIIALLFGGLTYLSFKDRKVNVI